MNKLTVLTLLTLLATTTFAQIKFAPEAGLNMAMQNIKIKSSDISTGSNEASKLAPGFSTGLMADLKLLKNMYLQVGIFYAYDNIKNTKDIDFSAYGLGTPTQTRYDRLNNLKIPLYLMYKSGFEGMGRFMAGIGPYVSYTFSGNRIYHIPVATYDNATGKVSGYTLYHSNTDMKLGNDVYQDQLRRWDYGVNACIGYESNVGLYFRGTVSYGMMNQDPANSDIYKVRNWNIGFSIGYLIGKDAW